MVYFIYLFKSGTRGQTWPCQEQRVCVINIVAHECQRLENRATQ